MRTLKRPENKEVEALRTLVNYRHQGTCWNTECKTTYEASWEDLEGFADSESYVHVHCPTCGTANVITIAAEDQAVIDYLRDQDISAFVLEDDDEDEDNE